MTNETEFPTDNRDPCNLRCATEGGILFSSTKCPPKSNNPIFGRLDQTCELPFGFIYTPMINIPKQQLSSHIFSPHLPSGVMCIKCMTYLNLYCEVDEPRLDTNGTTYAMQWKCALCQSENVLEVELDESHMSKEDTIHFFNTIISQRVVEFRQALGSTPMFHSPSTQRTCTIIVVLDENLPSIEAKAVGTVLRNIMAQNQESHNGESIQWRLGLIVFGEAISIFQLGVSSGIVIADKVRSHEGLLVMAEDDLSNRSYIGTSVDALITCLSAQYDIAKESHGNISINGDDTNFISTNESSIATTKKTRLEVLKQRKQARLQQQDGESTKLSENKKFTNLHSPWTSAREKTARSKPPYRCTVSAIQCAIDLALIDTNEISCILPTLEWPDANSCTIDTRQEKRVLLFTNGCPNLGDGSVVNTTENATGSLAAYSTVDSSLLARACECFNVIGNSSARAGVGMDVFCAGSSELGFPAYQSLVEPSSGYVLSHDSFTSSRFQYNLKFVFQKTHMSQAYFGLQKEEKSQTPEYPQQFPTSDGFWVDGCIVDIKKSRFLTSTHLIGPGELVSYPCGPLDNEKMTFSKGLLIAKEHQLPIDVDSPSVDILDATMTRIQVGRYDPMSTFSVMLRLNDSYHGAEHAFFQCVVRYLDISGGELVTRITSHRLSIANDVGEFLEAVDEEVVPVLLAKEAVYRSMFGRDVETDHPFYAAYIDELDSLAHDAQQDLDNTIYRISGAFRLLSLAHGTKSIDLTEEGGVKASGSSMDFAFPPELSDALRRLYHLRRGPLLSPGPVQSADDRAEMRSHFVRFPLNDCLNMMAPSLWSCGSTDNMLVQNGLLLVNVPPETLSLWGNRVIAADHWHNMFIWSGNETLNPTYDSIRAELQSFLLARSRKRFPCPNLYTLAESDSMSRRFTSLLGPSHGDPVEHQLAHFHSLTLLTHDELAKLHSRFRFYDPHTDPSFRRWFWDVASAASACGTDGVSLCD